MAKESIKKAFYGLEKSEQIELLKELSSSTGTSISIAEFSQKYQKRFGNNIEFEIKQTGLDHAPEITAKVITAFGSFEGIGSNQKIAKANACETAHNAWE